MARRYRMIEMRLVSEYLSDYFPKAHHFQRVRVGQLHPALQPERLSPEERRFVGVFRRWVDAIAITGNEVIIVEAAIYPELGDTGKLIAYGRLFPYTEEFREYWHWRIRKQLVFAVEDRFISELCFEQDIEPILFRPKWVEAYIKETRLYHKGTERVTFPSR